MSPQPAGSNNNHVDFAQYSPVDRLMFIRGTIKLGATALSGPNRRGAGGPRPPLNPRSRPTDSTLTLTRSTD